MPSIFFDLTDLPADFGNADAATIEVRTRGQNMQPDITDDFVRPDADAMGMSSEGWSWTETEGDIDIVSNQARVMVSTGETWARAEIDLSADHYSQAVLASTPTGGRASVVVRYDAIAKTAYFFSVTPAGDARLGKYVSGAFTLIEDIATGVPLAAGDVLRLEAVGSSLKSYVNGTLVHDQTDISIPDKTRVGVAPLSDTSIHYESFEAGSAIKLYAQLFQSDETTTLSDEVEVASHASDSAFANSSPITFTGLNTTANKAVWDAARIRFRWGT